MLKFVSSPPMRPIHHNRPNTMDWKGGEAESNPHGLPLKQSPPTVLIPINGLHLLIGDHH